MSLYENYNNTFNDYSDVRVPVGIDLIKNIIEKNKFRYIVDVGCGSGNYIKKLYEYTQLQKDKKFQLLGIDGSVSMLSKIPDEINTKHVIFNEKTKLELEDVDMIIINQVIHHLNKETLLNLIQECMNSLKEGGILYINTCTYDQVLYSQWWSMYYPKSGIEKFAQKANTANKIVLNHYKCKKTYLLPEPLQNNYHDYHIIRKITYMYLYGYNYIS